MGTARCLERSGRAGLFYEWVEEARSHVLNQILCDITLVTGFDTEQTSTMTRFDIANFVAESLSKGFRLAVLETPQQLARDRFGENVGANRGTVVKVTSD